MTEYPMPVRVAERLQPCTHVEQVPITAFAKEKP